MALRLGNQAGTSGLILGLQTNFTSTADIFGTGACVAQAASVAGTGIRGVVDLGSLPDLYAQPVTVVGVGEVIHVGSGALQAQSAAVVGVGAETGLTIGSGALQAGVAAVVGSGFKGIGGVGTLQAQAASVVGAGGLSGVVFGAGTLLAGVAAVVGAGERSILGAGNLTNGTATVLGSGTTVALAVNYTSYLPPNTIAIETLSLSMSYPLAFVSDRKRPLSTKVGWDDVVTYHEGRTEDLVTSYEFSKDKVFKEEEDSEY